MPIGLVRSAILSSALERREVAQRYLPILLLLTNLRNQRYSTAFRNKVIPWDEKTK
jgi:hypothetical protein